MTKLSLIEPLTCVNINEGDRIEKKQWCKLENKDKSNCRCYST
jgi:hypothetical protein